MMRVSHGSILLKDSVAPENLVPIFQCNEKHFSDISSAIDCSFVQDYQRRYILKTGAQPNHYFRCEFLSLLNAIFFIDITTIYCPHPIVYLRVRDLVNVEKLLIRNEDLLASEMNHTDAQR